MRYGAMAAALIAAPVLVLGDVWDEPRVVEFRDSPATVAGALIVLAAGVGACAAAFRRWPSALPVLAFAVLPFRVPVDIGGDTANLLIPLYVVIAAGVTSSLWAAFGRAGYGGGTAGAPPEVARRGDGVREAGLPGRKSQDPVSPLPGSVVWLKRLLAATLLLYAIQATYSEDVSNAIENAGFFLAPFAVMAVLLLEVSWTRRLLGQILIAIAAAAVSVALIGIGQYVARDLFLNPELFDANQLHQYFRVNSLFFDPNIFGRYLALAVTALAVWLAYGSGRRELTAAAAAAAVCLCGLAFSFSITSFAAVLAGLGVIALLRWSWRGAVAAAGIGAAGLIALAIAGGTPTSDIQSDRGFDSGRSDLIEGGLELAGVVEPDDDAPREDVGRPIAGHGSGSFGAAFVELIDPEARSVVSHSEPITVAAEQGAIGLVVYAGLLLTALLTILGDRVGDSIGRAAAAACFVALVVHSFGYAGFVIDPATWALLALGIALRAGTEIAGESVRARGAADPPARSASIPA